MTESEKSQIGTLINRIAQGDESALTVLYQTIGGRMLSVAFGVLRDRAAAEDALQESFVKIVKKADSFRTDKNGYGWALTIAKNTALNMLRKRKSRGEVPLDAFFDLTGESQPLADESGNKIAVRDALQKLDAPQREAIYLKYYLDCTVREIARKTDRSKSAVQRLIDAAEAALRRYLT